MRTVFLCYATENRDVANLIATNLRDAQFEVWLDDSRVRGGDEWRRSIDEGISSADVLLVLITPESCESKYVTYEWAFALGRGTKVIPLKVKESEVHPRLAVLQHLDFTNPRTRPWDRLYQEIDTVEKVTSPTKTESERVGNLTVEQFQKLIAGAISLVTATSKSGEAGAAPADISRAAKSMAEVMDTAQPAEGPAADAGRKPVLWVDDRPEGNVYERRAFESVGLSFTLAHSTLDALQKLSRQEFVVIISDMGRQEGPQEGYVLLDAVRKARIDTPFFIYAGSKSPQHTREAERRGAQGSTNDPQELFELVMSSISLRECREMVAWSESSLHAGKYKQAYDGLISAERRIKRFDSERVAASAIQELSQKIQRLKTLMARSGK